MSYYVYVLYGDKEDKFYIGYTSDLKRRINEHKANKVHTTLRYSDIKLIFHEVFICKEDALRREKYFKTTQGKRALKIMLKQTLAK